MASGLFFQEHGLAQQDPQQASKRKRSNGNGDPADNSPEEGFSITSSQGL